MSPVTPSEAGRVLVIGGANTDIVGYPDATLVARDSNPGRISSSDGGVGRNIAENLARLGASVSLLTAFGDDEMGVALAARCRVLGIDTDASLVADGIPGSRYLAILDAEGDMALATSDMRVLDLLTPEALEARRASIDEASFVVADANLSVASLSWLAENATCPLLFDPVSTRKSVRVKALCGALDVLKCNLIEAAAMLEAEPEQVADPAVAARRLRATGIRCAIVTAGIAGAFWADETGEGHVPSFRARVVNATGAGDAFSAGVAYALLAGADTARAVRFASAAATLTLAASETVSRQMSRPAVEKILEVEHA